MTVFRCVAFQPVVGGEDGVRLVVGEEIADHLRAFCHEETCTTAELLLFQLTDEFDLILTDCHRIIPTDFTDYTDYPVQRYKKMQRLFGLHGIFCNFADKLRQADENSDVETVFGDGRRSVDPVRLFGYQTSA